MSDSPVTLITGGSSGIGAAAARQLLELGHRVVVTGRSQDKLQRYADSLGNPAELLTHAGDASSWEAVSAAVSLAAESFGQLDNVVANAGYATHDGIGDGDPAGWPHMVLTNMLGPALLIHAALPWLRETRGRIVLVGSVAGFVHTPGNLYGATKFAVTGLAENTRLLVAPDGIGVTHVAPGPVDTNFHDAGGGPPAGRDLISADELAASIVWAVSQPYGVDINTMVIRPTGSPR